MGLKTNILTKSIWVYHMSVASCNNCDIEILACLTPRFDIERFGIQLAGSVRHADAILVTGIMNRKALLRAKTVYEQTPKPCFVIAVGTCPAGQGIFKGSYNAPEPVDKVLPVHAYVPGCPPKPEAIIAAVVKLINKVKG